MNSNLAHHGGNLNEEARRLGCNIDQLLDASASIVPFKPPRSLHQSLFQAISHKALRSYPDSTYEDLRNAIAKWHNINPALVLPGNGAAELFTWAAREAKGVGVNCLPSPGFSDYSRALRCWDAQFIETPLPMSWPSKMPQAFPLANQAEVIWITNPHNPTGQLWNKDSIESLIKTHNLVICDEAFLPLVPKGEKESMIPLVEKYPNLIVIRSLTKIFSIPGLRLGYAVSNPKRLRTWSTWRDPWPVNSLAVAGGISLMNNESSLKSWIKKVHTWIEEEGDWLQAKLKEIPGITPKPSSVNFLLIQGETSLTTLRENLARQMILVRDCRSFTYLGDNYLRISFQNKAGNKRIIKALQQLLI